jgi:hypothetical protein
MQIATDLRQPGVSGITDGDAVGLSPVMSENQEFAFRNTLTLSFPRKRESGATALSLALDPRFRGGDEFECDTSEQILL